MARQSTKPSFASIQAEFADPAYHVRKEAIKRLMRYHRKQAIEPLLAMLQDGRGEVRAAAVQAIGKLKDVRALTPVLDLLTDKHANVRAQAARTLGMFGERSVVPSLAALLTDAHSTICAYAARSLGNLRDPSSLPALLAYLEHARGNGDATELYHAIRAVGDFDAVEPLLTLYGRSLTSHRIIAEILSKHEGSTPLLLAEVLLDQTRPETACACAAHVFAFKPHPEFAPMLKAALTDDYRMVREYAAQALAQLPAFHASEIDTGVR